MAKPHKELKVWKDSIAFVKRIYEVTSSFPADEKFGLVSQMRRAAISVSSNIAEGAGRNNRKEFNQFLGIAQGSCAELETQLVISRELDFIESKSAEDLTNDLEQISRMIVGLRRTLMSDRS